MDRRTVLDAASEVDTMHPDPVTPDNEMYLVG